MLGAPGAGKTSYCIRFAHEGLLSEQAVVYVTTDDHPSQIRQMLRNQSPTISEEVVRKNLRIVDCYSWRTGGSEEHYASNPYLSELSLVASKAREGISNFRFVLDSISSLALESTQAALVKFLQVIYGKLKASGAIGLIVAEAGAHEQSLVNYLRFISDGVLEMSLEEIEGGILQRKFRIFCLRGTKHIASWVPVTISDEGIRLEI